MAALMSRAPFTVTIVNLVTGTPLSFFQVPEEFQEANSAAFSAQEVQGRSSPFQDYSASGPRTVSFSVLLHDDLCPGGLLPFVRKLKALTYPGYEGAIQPPSCYVRIGNMIKFKGFAGSVSVSWQKPYRDGVLLAAEVSLEFTECVDLPYSAADIEGGLG